MSDLSESNHRVAAPTGAEVEALLRMGLRNRWYPLCPASFVTDRPISLYRLGLKLVLWRDATGTIRVQDDHCPHRGAPLSIGRLLGDRIACAYHGVEVDRTGKLSGGDYDAFLCYTEWRTPWRYLAENNLDPMHGTFLHKQSHSMAVGDVQAKFELHNTPTGFRVEKATQRDVNFDWSEWCDTGMLYARLEIPYPASGGPGGNFEDRAVAEAMEIDASQRELLYQHDVGVTRLRRWLREEATAQLAALAAAGARKPWDPRPLGE